MDAPTDRKLERRAPLSFLLLAAGSFLAAVAMASPAQAASVPASLDEICPPDADPCIVDQAWDVSSIPFYLDFGTRTVRMQGNGQFDVKGGTESIDCGRFEAVKGSTPTFALTGAERFEVVPGGSIEVVAWKSCNDSPSTRCLDDAGCPVGPCSLGDGGISFGGSVQGDATQDSEFLLTAAGPVEVTGNVFMSGISPPPDEFTYGGYIIIDSRTGPVSFTGKFRAVGMDEGGLLDITSGGDVVIDAGLRLEGGFTGGSLVVNAAGDIRIDGRVGASAKGEADSYGGTVTLAAGGDIFLGTDKLKMALRGQGLYGYGGTFTATSAAAFVVEQRAKVDVRGGSDAYSSGGYAALSAGTDLAINGSVSVVSKGDGGLALLSAPGNVSVGDTGRVDASGGRSDGGSVTVTGGQGVSVSGSIRARGKQAAGSILVSGGDVAVSGGLDIRGVTSGAGLELHGCQIQLEDGAAIDVNVPGGAGLRTFSSGQLTIASGAEVSAPADGAHVFEYRSDGPIPVILGSVDPSPTLTPVAGTPCP